ncbi:DUF4355 domain-containing protein [Sporanaerobacter acetigenes]|uniref:DUF4355 domain-containing protein n=1 Tax=Sporanaerobacter acetigenes TaxID=165813 RepID=UPI001304E4F2|nr:DUF4355 domain-containing protein [Sporanaerobacter acetigenes]
MGKCNSTPRDNSNLKGINLQLFADEGEEVKETDDIQDKAVEGKEETKTYTQEELDTKLQSETDKRVTEALKTARAKWEKEYEEKLVKEKKEAERLSKLSADEREKELIKQKQLELEEKEKAIQYRELQLDTVKVLADENLPAGFAEFLIQNDAETTNENIKKFKKEWQEALTKEVDERIKGKSPSIGGQNLKTEGIGERLAKTVIRNEEVKKNNPYF